MQHAFVDICFEEGAFKVWSAVTGREDKDVKQEQIKDDWKSRPVVRRSPNEPPDVLQWCQENEGKSWLGGLGELGSAWRNLRCGAVQIFCSAGTCMPEGDACFANLEALENFADIDPTVLADIRNRSPVGDKCRIRPGAKEGDSRVEIEEVMWLLFF